MSTYKNQHVFVNVLQNCKLTPLPKDEDDRPLLSGCINRHKVFWSNSFFHITSEKGGGEGGTRVYRPLDEFMGGGKRVMVSWFLREEEEGREKGEIESDK